MRRRCELVRMQPIFRSVMRRLDTSGNCKCICIVQSQVYLFVLDASMHAFRSASSPTLNLAYFKPDLSRYNSTLGL